MSKAKIVFNQTLMISSGILFEFGVQAVIRHFVSNEFVIEWAWYQPLAIIFTAFLCSVLSLLLLDDEKISSKHIRIRILFHFISIWGVVTLLGYFFHWYTSFRHYITIVIMYVLLYGFVWIAMQWFTKNTENEINEAIKKIQDEE